MRVNHCNIEASGSGRLPCRRAQEHFAEGWRFVWRSYDFVWWNGGSTTRFISSVMWGLENTLTLN
jgi:hypothetical protein